ncbi:hypothetical protein CLV78_105185 [Aliiruegeria haliotis]|uniref:Uncharacterized protein n=1 Tax=Aliiruegeria haliotis TaxID=1280846 RepID=A0A2T0RPW7_9RHOB|nr:hypothetical protein CLV78_105185 [Aliiruegeria haliotis]
MTFSIPDMILDMRRTKSPVVQAGPSEGAGTDVQPGLPIAAISLSTGLAGWDRI